MILCWATLICSTLLGHMRPAGLDNPALEPMDKFYVASLIRVEYFDKLNFDSLKCNRKKSGFDAHVICRAKTAAEKPLSLAPLSFPRSRWLYSLERRNEYSYEKVKVRAKTATMTSPRPSLLIDIF